MRDAPKNINYDFDYLGPHEIIIQVGYQQHIIFQEGNDVPLWMTPQELLATKFSQYDEPQLKDKTNAELLGNLKSARVDISVVKGKRAGELQDIYPKS